MKKTTLALALLAGLCLASCDKTSNGGDTPNPNPGNKDPKNILEVGQLLSSAGRVAEAAEDKLTAKPVGSPTSVPAPGHTMESNNEQTD